VSYRVALDGFRAGTFQPFPDVRRQAFRGAHAVEARRHRDSDTELLGNRWLRQLRGPLVGVCPAYAAWSLRSGTQFSRSTLCCQFGIDSRRALGNWSLEANARWLRLMERCPGLGLARFAEAGPLDLKWRCSSTSLRLLPRIVLRVDVGKSPGTIGADLYNRLFFHEDIV